MDETTEPRFMAKEIMSKILSFAADEEDEEIMSILSSWGFKEELNRLQETAKMVQALLYYVSANNETQRYGSVRTWLKKLNDVAYDADAVLEEFNYQTLRWKLEINPKIPSKNMVLKITSINKSLDEIYKQGTLIRLIRLQEVKSLDANLEHTQIQLTYPYVDDSEVFGREAEVSEVLHELCFSESEKNLSLMAIVGRGGLGKTTLAQIVCNHDKVVRHFDETIWITVSKDFDVTRILNEMVQSLIGKNPRLSIVEEIIKNELEGRLKGKRYLLILDDVWNQDRDKWEYLIKALLGIDGSRGSKIMETTRNDEVTLMMQASFIHRMRYLSWDESWAIFKQRAFAKGGPTETQNMVDIGRKILTMSEGLPLVIKAIGGLMYSKAPFDCKVEKENKLS